MTLRRIGRCLAPLFLALTLILPSAAHAAGPPDPAYTQGVDVSTWNAKTPTGFAFVIARASYGMWIDQDFARHVAIYRAAGKYDCAYHFGIATADPRAQAARFLQASKGTDCRALDVESDPAGMMTPAQAHAFIDAIHAAGLKIGLYMSESAMPADLYGADWAWVANWSRKPARAWSLWQWSGSPVDKDEYHGSLVLFKSWIGAQRLVPEGPITVASVAAATPALTYFGAQESQLRHYIDELAEVAHPNALQIGELTTYRARLVVVRANIRYLQGIITVAGYIRRLAAVAHPTARQKAELVTYRERLAGWLANPRLQ